MLTELLALYGGWHLFFGKKGGNNGNGKGNDNDGCAGCCGCLVIIVLIAALTGGCALIC